MFVTIVAKQRLTSICIHLFLINQDANIFQYQSDIIHCKQKFLESLLQKPLNVLFSSRKLTSECPYCNPTNRNCQNAKYHGQIDLFIQLIKIGKQNEIVSLILNLFTQAKQGRITLGIFEMQKKSEQIAFLMVSIPMF